MNRNKAFKNLIESCEIVLPKHRKETWNVQIEGILRYANLDDKELDECLDIIFTDTIIVQTLQNLLFKALGKNLIPFSELPLSEEEKNLLSGILYKHGKTRLLKLLTNRAGS